MSKDETRIHLRKCFETVEGKRALAWLMANAGCFDDELTERDLPVINFVNKLLKELGVYDKENIDSIALKLMEIPVNLERKEEINEEE